MAAEPDQQILGQGSQGKIYSVDQATVVKKIPKTSDNQILFGAITEIVYSLNLDHPHIIKYTQVSYDSDDILIQMPRYQGDLKQLIDRSGPLANYPIEFFNDLAGQLESALLYLATRDIIHRDIKPENILYQYKDRRYYLTLADFGIATDKACLRSIRNRDYYTVLYRPAEIELEFPHSLLADIYALGCVFYQIYTGQYLIDPEKINNKEPLLNLINEAVGAPEEDSIIYPSYKIAVSEPKPRRVDFVTDPVLNQVLYRMLSPDPGRRIDIFELTGQIANSCRDRLTMIDQDIFHFRIIERLTKPIYEENVISLIIMKNALIIPDNVFFTTLNIFNRYVRATDNINPNRLPTILVSCLILAIRYHNEYLATEDLILYTNLDQQQLTDRALQIALTLNYDFSRTTIYDWLVLESTGLLLGVCSVAVNLLVVSSVFVLKSQIKVIIDLAKIYFGQVVIEPDFFAMRIFLKAIVRFHRRPDLTLYPFITKDTLERLLELVG